MVVMAIKSMAEMELSVSSHRVSLVTPAGAHAELHVELPAPVDDAAAAARFDKKSRRLTVRLPLRDRAR